MLITLALIVAISALVYIGLGVVNKASKEVEDKHFLVQTDIFVNSVIDVLKSRESDINSSEGFELLLNLPIDLISEEVRAHIEFDSAAKGLNPNNFIKVVNKKEKINPDYVLLFDRILQSADVLNKELFIAMIEDTLDKDLEERIPGSEIALYDKRFLQGKIENFKKFEMIMEHYMKLTQDGSIKKIGWRDILGFYSKKIDVNYISPLLVRYIIPYADDELIKKVFVDRVVLYKSVDELNLPKEERDELKKFNISGFVPVVKADVNIEQGNTKSSATFVFNIKKKKVLDIEERLF